MEYFHFTLGPVQGFVAQARRTRDFWAGSFILSWLSAVAMKAVEQQGGKVIFPMPNAIFMNAIENGGKTGPKQGSIPNRFMAKVDSEFKPDDIVIAVEAAWQALADKVWEKDLKTLLSTNTK